MAYSYPELKNFVGLYLQQNSFTVPDGALEIAQNVVINKDGIITKSRGVYTYFTPSVGTLNKLFNYQSHLLSAYTDAISYYTDTGSSPNETGTQTALSGETVSITNGRVSRSMLANNNFYFTTDNGVLKLTAYNSAISKTGAPQGLDVQASFISGTNSTFLGAGKTVGYRVLFGYIDANDNLIIGAPSSIAVINNTLVDNASIVVAGAGPYTITVTSVAHGLVTGDYLIFSGGVGGTVANYEGVYQITVTGVDTFTYSVVNNPGAATSVDYALAESVLLEFSIPSEVTTALPWFVQIYRSSQQDIAVGVLSDYRLLEQRTLTAAEIAADVGFFTDDFADLILGAELYTNENSREGELQANFRPPLCDDIAVYKGHAIYAKCTTRHLLDLALIDPTQLANGDYVEFKIDATTRRYTAVTGIGNFTVDATVTNAAGDLQVNYTAHGFSNGWTVYISNVTGGTLVAGTYFVVSAAANTFEISLTSGGASIAFAGESKLYFEGVTNGTNNIFYLSQSTSAATRIRDTAESLVKAINRDTGSLIYAQYVSTPSEIPGKMRFQSKGFGLAMYVRANTTTAGSAFLPPLPDSFASGVQVFSRNDDLPHVFFASKQNEPEAVPLVNFFIVGAKNKPIIRVHALRDSLIVLKEDGVFCVTGDNVGNFNVTLLDSTVQIVAASSSDVLNNQVVFLGNQGVCLVTESSVQIISRKIEDVIQPILGQTNLAAQTSGLAYETERLYLLTTTNPNSTSATQTYAYNILTDSWSSFTSLFKQAVIGPSDVAFYISFVNDIKKERKKQTKIDYTGQNHTVTISNLSSDTASCDITFAVGATPEEGDVIIKSEVINRIAEPPVFISGSTWSVTFTLATNLVNADVVILYKMYESIIKSSPFHAGLVGRSKLFSQMQVQIRDASVSKLSITFVGNSFGSSEEVEWTSQLNSLGWGLFPWGFEPWGQADTINLTQGTTPAPIIRVYIPKFQARNTFIQPYLSHKEAAEPLNFQAMTFAVRAYGERVSR